MDYLLLQKQEKKFKSTKPLNQKPNIKAQTSDEIQPLEIYLVSCYQNQQAILICFSQDGVTLNSMYILYLKTVFISRKKTFRIVSNIDIFFKQNLRDIMLLFDDIAGLDMKLQEGFLRLWKSFWTGDWFG